MCADLRVVGLVLVMSRNERCLLSMQETRRDGWGCLKVQACR